MKKGIHHPLAWLLEYRRQKRENEFRSQQAKDEPVVAQLSEIEHIGWEYSLKNIASIDKKSSEECEDIENKQLKTKALKNKAEFQLENGVSPLEVEFPKLTVKGLKRNAKI